MVDRLVAKLDDETKEHLVEARFQLSIKNPDAFAYCKVSEDGKTITEVVEKATISNKPHLDPTVVGTFWYRRAADFKRGTFS